MSGADLRILPLPDGEFIPVIANADDELMDSIGQWGPGLPQDPEAPRPVRQSAEDVIREANWQWEQLGGNATEDREGYILSALRAAGYLGEK